MARLKKNGLCTKALELFTSIYGAAAGNLALQVMAVGGVYVGGGIAPKIIWKLKDGTFMKAFKNKGRLSHIVAHIPVKVIMNEKTALLGAASCAANLIFPLSPYLPAGRRWGEGWGEGEEKS
jgi:glucokinase